MAIDEYFARRPPGDRAIYEAVASHLCDAGDVDVEAVSVGILFKHRRTFVELRPRKAGMALSMLLPRQIDEPPVTRHVRATGTQIANYVHLKTAADVDDRVRGWLTESYIASAAARL
jgi:predicted transport protein